MTTWKKSWTVRAITVGAIALLSAAPAAVAREDPDARGPAVYHHIGTVTEPAISAIAAGKTPRNPTGLFASFDISWVDNERDIYYLADRSNNAIDMVDATDGSFIKYLGQGKFAGVVTGTPNRSGPDGVLTDRQGNVWAGDGLPDGTGLTHSSLKGFNPDTGEMIANIDNGGDARADELAYGPVGGGRILIANPNEPITAFVTLVNTPTKTIIGKVLYDEPAHAGLPSDGHGFSTNFGGTQHGLEQPVFMNGSFYLNVPGTIQNPGGEIDGFGPNQPRVTDVLPLSTCGGTGLAALPSGDLLVECADSARIVSTRGQVLASFPILGASDEIWFNPGDGNAYFALPATTGEPTGARPAGLGVLDVAQRHVVGVFALPGAQGLHSIAVDANNNRIFIPNNDNPDNGAGGIAMMHRARSRQERSDQE